VGASVAIKQVKDNYEGRMKRSLEALLTLQGGTMDLGNNASRESRHQELKYNEDMDVFNEGEDVRTVSFADKVTEQVLTSSKPAAWHFGSDELDLDKWRVQKNKRQAQKATYSETLKGSAPGPSAQLREPLLKFVKKKRNTVRR
jgi:N-acetyl-beta-hexosaminidase